MLRGVKWRSIEEWRQARARSRLIRRLWPPVLVGHSVVPGVVKSVSLATLVRLQNAASSEDGVSATGRPQWVADHSGDIYHVLVTVFSIECEGWHRCVVVPFDIDGAMGMFSLGISEEEFDRLPAVAWLEAADLLRGLLLRVKHIPLDPDGTASRQGASDADPL